MATKFSSYGLESVGGHRPKTGPADQDARTLLSAINATFKAVRTEAHQTLCAAASDARGAHLTEIEKSTLVAPAERIEQAARTALFRLFANRGFREALRRDFRRGSMRALAAKALEARKAIQKKSQRREARLRKAIAEVKKKDIKSAEAIARVINRDPARFLGRDYYAPSTVQRKVREIVSKERK